MESERGLRDHKNGVLKFSATEIAVALHFVDIPSGMPGTSDDGAAPNVFSSMERDLLAYQFQVAPPLRSFSHSTNKLLIKMPEKYKYFTEDKWIEASRKREPIVARVTLSCSVFGASGAHVWHCVITPDDGEVFDEFDIIALIHLYDGRAESSKDIRNKVKFILGDPVTGEATNGRELLERLRAFAGRTCPDQIAAAGEQRRLEKCHNDFVAGTIQIAPSAEDALSLKNLLLKVFDSRKNALTQEICLPGSGNAIDNTANKQDSPLGELQKLHSDWKKSTSGRMEEPWQKLLAFGGIVVGIFDFEEVDVEELLDTISPTFTDGHVFVQIHRCTLIGFTPEDRLFGVPGVREKIGINPYLLLPHAVILQNEALVEIAEDNLKIIRDRMHVAWRDPWLFVRIDSVFAGLRDKSVRDWLGKLKSVRSVSARFGEFRVLRSKLRADSRADVHCVDAGQNEDLLSIQQLERKLETATRCLGEYQLPNIFNYVTERTVFDMGMVTRGSREKHKTVEAKRAIVREQINLLWKLRAEWGQIWLAAIAAAISGIPMRTVFKDVLNISDSSAFLMALSISLILVGLVVYLRGAGVRKKSA